MLSRLPVFSAIAGNGNILDSVSAVKRDAFQGGAAGFQLAPSATFVMNERTLSLLIGMVALGAVPGSTQWFSLSGNSIGGLHPEAVEMPSTMLISLRCLTQ